ncbi:MAG: phosphate acyltransferase PlsX [Chloroflexota bacterium]
MEVNANKTIKIALDAMGGDFAPKNEVEGAVLAYEKLSKNANIEIVFYGDEKKIRAALAKAGSNNLKYSIVHSDEVVTMHDDPTEIYKTKKDSSLYRSLESQRKGDCDATVSAGNTGATMALGTILLGRIRNVSRPTIGSFFPTQTSRPTLVLDVGANVDSKPRFLYEYGVMGAIYSEHIMGLKSPRVGLLNIGEEPTKGNAAVREAHELLSASDLNFAGNMEGRDIFSGEFDVVICDGFVGNVILKFAESFLGLLKTKFKDFASKGIKNKLMVALALPVMKKILKGFDYQEYGGVPLLGVNGVVIIGHGKSTPLAISNMLLRAAEQIEKNINGKIEQALNPGNYSNNEKK